MSTYVYKDEADNWMAIEPSENHDNSVIFVHTEAEVYIPAADLPRIVTELYKAAGLPEPILLERPEWDVQSESIPAGPYGVHYIGRNVHIGADRGMTPEAARQLAAALAVMAEQAEGEPADEDVQALADLIEEYDSRATPSTSDGLARALLSAGVRLPERDGDV